MKVNIVSKGQNPLMKRKEITFSVDHAQNGGTPSRAQVCNQLASLLKTKPELVFVKNMKTKTGTMVAVGEANVYDSLEQAKSMEPKHIVARNVVSEKKSEDAEAPKEDAPEEAPEEALEKKEEE
jgi:ribosomal protein S24E